MRKADTCTFMTISFAWWRYSIAPILGACCVVVACSSSDDSGAGPNDQTPDGGVPDGQTNPLPGTPDPKGAAISALAAGGARAAMDAEGNVIAVWGQLNDQGKQHYWASRYVVETGWGTPSQLEENIGDPSSNEFPQIAMAPNGMAMVVWTQLTTSGAYDIWARPFDPASGWGTVERIDEGQYHAVDPSVGIDDAGNAIVAWQQTQDLAARTKIVARRYVRGTGWSGVTPPFATPTVSGGADSSPKVAVAPNGDAVVAFSSNGSIWWSKYTENAWAAAAVLVEDTDSYRAIGNPSLAIDATGKALVAWRQRDFVGGAAKSTVFFKRYSNTWTAEAEVTPPVTADDYADVSLAMNANGAAVIVWKRPDLSLQAATAPAGGTWTVNAVKPAGVLDVTSGPQVAIDGNGTAYATWGQKTGEQYQTDLYMSTFTSGAWSAPSLAEETDESAQDPFVAVNAAGSQVFLWTAFAKDGNGATQVFGRVAAR